MTQTSRSVGIFVFDGVEPLDTVGPFEAFLCAENADEEALFDVFLFAETRAPVTATGGLIMTPRHGFGDLPSIDILLVPGGNGTRTLSKRNDITSWVEQRHADCDLTLSVCTGAQVLAAAGLLKNQKTTTHWATYDWLRSIEPDVDVQEGARYVDNGDIVCSSGVSAGIDMALHVIERLHGADVAARAARNMEYEYWPQGRVA